MKKLSMLKHGCLIFILSSVFHNSQAWNHSIQLGVGHSHDPNHSKYENTGVLFTADLLPLLRTQYTFWSITGALNQWYTNSPVHKNLSAAALSLALRVYPFEIAHRYPSYILASAGPALLSHRRFGLNTQASNLTIQSNIGVGVEFNCFDVNFRLDHFSNANLGNPNEGFNILYLLSFGYLF